MPLFLKSETFLSLAALAGFAGQALMQVHGMWPPVFDWVAQNANTIYQFALEGIGTVGLYFTGLMFAISAFGLLRFRQRKSQIENPDNLGRAIAWAFILIPLATIVLQWIPELQIGMLGDHTLSPRTSIPELRDQYRNTLMKILGGAVVLAGLFVAWQRTHAALKAVEATERGQVTERFTRAIEHLGAIHGAGTAKERPNIEVRLGGIYALAQIAREDGDSDGDLRKQIVDILAAYLRENAAITKGNQAAAMLPGIEYGDDFDELGRLGAKREDIQAVLDVLFANSGIHSADKLLRLEACDFSGAILINSSMQDVFFYRSRFIKSYFYHAKLLNCHFLSADLSEARLSNADLTDSSLHNSDLSEAILEDTDLENVDLQQADLSKAIGLTREQLQQAKIYKSTKLPPEFADLAENGLDDEEG